MKSYYRYEPSHSFGLITTPRSNAIYDYSGNLCLSGCLQDCKVWNIRQGSQIASITDVVPNYPYAVNGEITVVQRCPDKSNAVVGYSNGEIKVINYIQKNVVTTMRGHRSAVSCIAFSECASGDSVSSTAPSKKRRHGDAAALLMASGGMDNDINVWDFISHTGLCKLRGHKDTVTDVSFINTHSNSEDNSKVVSKMLLVSVSKDSLMKVWDLTTYSCLQTIVGHRCEIYSCVTVYFNNPESGSGMDGGEIRVYTGAADEMIRGYRVSLNQKETSTEDAFDIAETTPVLEYYGSLIRGGGGLGDVGSSNGGAIPLNMLDRCVALTVNSTNTILAAQSAGKVIEFYYIRTPDEIKKKFKRRTKRIRDKAAKDEEEPSSKKSKNNNAEATSRNNSAGSVWEDAIVVKNDSEETESKLNGVNNKVPDIQLEQLLIGDELEYLGNIRTLHKVKGIDFHPNPKIESDTVSETVDTGEKEKKQKSKKDGTGSNTGTVIKNVTTVTTSNRIMISLGNNTLLYYDVSIKQQQQQSINTSKNGLSTGLSQLTLVSAYVFTPTKVSVLEYPGHRNEIRSVAFSSDSSTIVTCSSDELKCWNRRNQTCSRSIATNASYSVCLALVPGDKYALIGTKEGHILVVDIMAGDIIHIQEDAHTGAIWSIAVKPDGKGFMSGSADKDVKFWDFTLKEQGSNKLSIKLTRQLQMTHDVLTLRYSNTTHSDKLLLAVGLLDNTVKVFYDDSLKFFLSLYGHKAPVMCLDMSYDNTILVSGSADKTIKIWGLDFGDCHRSLIAHSDSVTCIKFQPKTHYFFSGGKDGVLKYWDADRFEQILQLPGHVSGIWGLDISSDTSVITTVSQDRSIRLWERNVNDFVFIEEEKERAMEAMVSDSIEKQNNQQSQLTTDEDKDTVAAVTSSHIDVVKGGEKLMEVIDLAEKELGEMQAVEEATKAAIKRGDKTNTVARYTANPMLQGVSPYQYIINSIKLHIKGSEMESALIILPFHYVVRFLPLLTEICRQHLDIELSTKCVIILLKCHMARLAVTPSLTNDMLALKNMVRHSISNYRNTIGSNIAALTYLKNKVESKQNETF